MFHTHDGDFTLITNKAYNKSLHIPPKIALLIKLVAIFWVFVFTNASFAYGEPNFSNHESKTIQIQLQYQNVSNELSSYNTHEDCDNRCCNKQCHCTTVSCATISLILTNATPLYLKSYHSFSPLIGFYHFSPLSLLNRPPILS